jgi:hypothetical protein
MPVHTTRLVFGLQSGNGAGRLGYLPFCCAMVETEA